MALKYLQGKQLFSTSLSTTQMKVAAGCFLINLPLGLSYGFGNFYPYLYSYIRFHLSADSEWDLDPAWLFPSLIAVRCISSVTSGFIKRRLGLRFSMLFAVLLFSTSLFLTYFCFQHSVWMTFISYVIIHGYGTGLVICYNLGFVTSCFDKSVGRAAACVASSSGVGCIFLNFLLTAYVNPDNLSTDVKENGFTFFSQRGIVERAPMIWVIVGVVASSCTGLGFCLVACQTCENKNTSSKDADARTVNNGNIHLDEGQRIQSSGCQPQTYNTCCNRDSAISSADSYRLQDNALTSNGDAESCSSLQQQEEHATPISSREDKSLNQAMRSAPFYALWFYSVASTLTQIIALNYYKMLGQLWISNDWFLTLTGNVSAVFLIGVRLLLGKLVDTCGIKNTFVALSSTQCVMLVLWYFTAMLNPWLFLIWTDVLSSINANNVIMLPLAALKYFGPSNYIELFGIFQMAAVLVNVIFPSLFSFLVNTMGWFWVLLVGSGVMLLALLLVLGFLKKF